MSVFDRAFTLVCSLSCLGAGLVIATFHPVAPFLATTLFCFALAVFSWQPSLALPTLVALLPLLNFSPWTGWLVVDEFDLLVLAVLATGYFGMCRQGLRIHDRWIYFVLLAAVVLSIARGASELSVQDLSAFADYVAPLNRLRVGKSLLWVTLLIPLFSADRRFACDSGTISRFFWACALGSAVVVLAILWERGFYPGILDFSTPYRTVALFWEMHVGGAALDVYLVLMAPILVWVWRSMGSLASRVAFGVYVLAFVYACLTTYSRGVMASILGSMLILVAMLTHLRVKGRQAARTFTMVGGLVVALVLLEVVLVVGADTYLNRRLSATDHDFGGRVEHWARGIGLLNTPREWLFGIGLGKLPARLTQGETGLPLPGMFYLDEVSGRQTMALVGPDPSRRLQPGDGFYSLSQRIDLEAGQGYRLAADVFSRNNSEMLVKLCAVHLLYPARCRDRIIRFDSNGWQHKETTVLRPLFDIGQWQASGHGVLSVSVLTPGTKIELARLYLSNGTNNILRNARFQNGVAGWFPVARFYFMPWHIDNLYLEILIETGLTGLLGFALVVSAIMKQVIQSCIGGNAFAPYLLSSLAGLMILGLVVSVLDMPRVAILCGLMLLVAWKSSRHCTAATEPASVK